MVDNLADDTQSSALSVRSQWAATRVLDDDASSVASARGKGTATPVLLEDDDESSALSVRGWAPTDLAGSTEDEDERVDEEDSGEADSPVLPSAAVSATNFAEDDDETSEMPVSVWDCVCDAERSN